MSPHQLLRALRRWLWLVVLGTVLTGAATYAVSLQLPRVFEARTRLMVSPGQAVRGVDTYNDVLAAERLTRTYAEVVTSRPVIEAAIDAGDLGLRAEQAALLLEVTPLRDTQLIQITAQAAEPALAAGLANHVASAFIQRIQASQASRFAVSKEGLARQLEQLGADLSERSRHVELLRGQPGDQVRETELARAQFDLAQLQQAYATARRAYEDVLMSEARSSDLITVVEPAVPSMTPAQPRLAVNTALGAFVGFMLALSVAWLAELVDDRLTSPDRVRRFGGLNTLAVLPQLPRSRVPRQGRDEPASSPGSDDPISPLAPAYAESFRRLRGSLQLSDPAQARQVVLIAGVQGAEGATFSAARLAVVAARAGRRVILVDADLQRPTLHELFGVPNMTGLMSLLRDHEFPLESAVATTPVAGLDLLPVGPAARHGGDLLASPLMDNLLYELRTQAHLVIIDAPPVLASGDTVALGSAVDGAVLVVNARKTHGRALERAIGLLEMSGTRVLGAVLIGAEPGENPDATQRASHVEKTAPGGVADASFPRVENVGAG